MEILNTGFNIEEYLKRFKVYHEVTLFPPNWDALKVKRCPLCGCKLKVPQRNKTIAMCSSKKHAKPFIIKKEAFDKLTK